MYKILFIGDSLESKKYLNVYKNKKKMAEKKAESLNLKLSAYYICAWIPQMIDFTTLHRHLDNIDDSYYILHRDKIKKPSHRGLINVQDLQKYLHYSF